MLGTTPLSTAIATTGRQLFSAITAAFPDFSPTEFLPVAQAAAAKLAARRH